MKKVFYFLKRFLLPHIFLFITVLGTGVLAASASGLGVPLLVKYVFPVVFRAPDGATPELLEIFPALLELSPSVLLMLACASLPAIFIVRGVAVWANAVMVNVLGIRILETLRMAVFNRVQELPVAFMEERQKGDIISRVVADTQNVQNILSTIANDLVKQPITCISALAAFIWLLVQSGHGILFLVNVAFIGLAAWPIIVFGRRISQKALRAQEGLGALNAAIQQNLETQREVRAYALEEREIRDFRVVSDGYCNNYVKLVKYQKALIPVMEIVTSLALAFLLVRGKQLGMSLTDFIAMAGALYFAFDSMKRAGNAFNRFNEAQGALQRLSEVLDEPNSIPNPETPVKLAQPVRGDITFRNVSFSYNKESGLALRDINVHIPAGQIVGLVGPSGAGKTTFASLIPRFYEVSAGSVELDGVDIRCLSQHELREELSLVGQQALLFTGTIRDNIRLGKLDATDEEIKDAADAAAVSKFLESQKQGLDTKLGQGGAGLSGGQRQRVAIARAFVKNAPVLILDEATASLDAESEREIQESLDDLAKGRTTLIVAHRFSTIRNADRILVFEGGRIVGDGPHEQLYRICPLYKELYDRQGIQG
ncbi:MAG: ABC transporter ATP-binding protein [Akkermansia sp.]|nr:ABC transporter ATP-binding protein [Akkermansia sp.]